MRRGFLLDARDVFRREGSRSDSPPPLAARRNSGDSECPPPLLDAYDVRCGEPSSNSSSLSSLHVYGEHVSGGNECPSLSRVGHDGTIIDMAQYSIESMSRGFIRPRCHNDPFNILHGSEREDPHCISRFMDLHIWCVDNENNILDYPPEQIDSLYWSDDIVYRPFDAKLVALIYNDVIHYAKQCETYKNTISRMSQDEKMAAIQDNTFPKRNCLWRALALQESDPSKYALVFGSIGFRQSNGEIFWEYG